MIPGKPMNAVFCLEYERHSECYVLAYGILVNLLDWCFHGLLPCVLGRRSAPGAAHGGANCGWVQACSEDGARSCSGEGEADLPPC